MATPIGNLQDLSARAISVLQNVALIAAEDTRHSQTLFRQFNIRSQCLPYHEHSAEKTARAVISELAAGQDVALISDAGTPLISDPGYRLIDQVQTAGYRVSPIPGACALVAALSASGLPTDAFRFYGFLPAKSAARIRRLESLQDSPDTLVFYEAPHRIAEFCRDCSTVFGAERQAVLARELTKQFETIARGALGELSAWIDQDSNQQRGEIVMLIEGLKGDSQHAELEAQRVLSLLLTELPVKRAAKLASEITGAKKNHLYDLALQWQDEQK